MNRYVIIGWLGGNSEMFVFIDMQKGKQVAASMRSSEAWREVYCGSLIDLITLLEEREK